MVARTKPIRQKQVGRVDSAMNDVEYMGRPRLEHLLNCGVNDAIIDALQSAAHFDSDWRWVQNQCLRFLDHPEKWVKWNAVYCLGFLAIRHKTIDAALVVPELHKVTGDAEVLRAAGNSLALIDHVCFGKPLPPD
jgi:hypothetical protein